MGLADKLVRNRFAGACHRKNATFFLWQAIYRLDDRPGRLRYWEAS